MFIIDILRNSCYLLEFTARLVLVNIPSYLLAKSPEIDRISSIAFAYLTFQVVGLCWAFLVNAAFSLATRLTAFLPPLNLTNDSNLTSPSLNIAPSLLSSPHTSVQLIAIFYVSYASIRVVVSFAQSVFHIALESIKDFPDTARVLSRGGVFTLHLTPIVFTPALFLELGLIFADPFCSEVVEGVIQSNTIQAGICNHTGLFYLTSAYSEVRRIIFYAVIAMVLQIWQAHLHQFPRWDLTFKELSPVIRFLYQLAVLLLTMFTLIAIGLVVILRVEMNSLESVVCGVLLGWTIWLFSFTPFLVATHGQVWASRVSSRSIQHLAAYLRISHMLIFVIIFCCVYFSTGFVQAQMDIIFATIFIPALYSCFFLLASACIRAGSTILIRGVPLAIVISLIVTLLLAKSGGKGGIILVFLHIFGKIIHFFGDEIDDAAEEERGWMDDSNHNQDKNNTQHLKSSEERGLTNSKKNLSYLPAPVLNTKPECLDSLSEQGNSIDGELDRHLTKISSIIPRSSSDNLEDLSPIADSKGTVRDTSSQKTQVVLDRNSDSGSSIPSSSLGKADKLTGSKSVTSYGKSSGANSKDYHSRASSDALHLLSERGQAGSSFVSLGLPKSIGAHWLVRTSQRNMSYVGHIMRKITVSDSLITGILRVFTAIGAIFTLILCTLSVASVAQQNLQFFPRSFDFEVNADGSVLFDHKIANVTLYPKDHHKVIVENPTSSSSFSINRRSFKKNLKEEDNLKSSNKDNVFGPLKKPHYAACSWSWHSLSLFDFALFSEVAYFDERQGNQVQDLVSTLMPDAGFRVHLDSRDKDLSLESQGGRPMYLELTSEILGVTVLAIRGTDIGRMHDFMEDIKMFAGAVMKTKIVFILILAIVVVVSFFLYCSQ